MYILLVDCLRLQGTLISMALGELQLALTELELAVDLSHGSCVLLVIHTRMLRGSGCVRLLDLAWDSENTEP